MGQKDLGFWGSWKIFPTYQLFLVWESMVLGPKIRFFQKTYQETWCFTLFGLRGCDYGIWVCLGEKNQLYCQKWPSQDVKPSKFDPNLPFLKIYRKIKFYSFNSWPYLIYNLCHFMAHFKSHIDHCYGPAGFGILRFMENFSHIPTF